MAERGDLGGPAGNGERPVLPLYPPGVPVRLQDPIINFSFLLRWSHFNFICNESLKYQPYHLGTFPDVSGAVLNLVMLCGTWAGPSLPAQAMRGHWVTHGATGSMGTALGAGKSSAPISNAAALRLPWGLFLAPRGCPSCPRASGLSSSPWHMALPHPPATSQLSPPAPCSLSPLCPRL